MCEDKFKPRVIFFLADAFPLHTLLDGRVDTEETQRQRCRSGPHTQHECDKPGGQYQEAVGEKARHEDVGRMAYHIVGDMTG